jgi:hypothetical protein
MRTLPYLLLALVLAPLLLRAEAPLPDLKGVRVLVCAPYFDLPNIPALRRLRTAGAEVGTASLGSLTWETVNQYNLLILVANTGGEKENVKPTAAQAIERFVKEGGGVLYFRHYYYSESTNVLLAPFGASMPWEIVQDPAHAFTNPVGFNLNYAYTDRVTPKHPITEGVKGLWYPAGQQHLFHTSPLKLSPEWTVLATGMPEAKSLWVGGLHEEHLTKPGLYATAPPIAAAREFGAGAMVLLGSSPMEIFYGQGLPAYGEIGLSRGNGLQASDFGLLYANAIGWLAKHARASTTLAQGALPKQENGWATPQPVPDWKTFAPGPDLCTRPARGVIGLHSTLSDGKATPAAFIATGKALGLQWLAFTERLESFSPQKWEQLRKICTDASTPDFAVLPGLDYADATGTRYVVFGDFAWPPEKVFSEDKQRIVEPCWWFNIGCVPNGPYDLAHAPLRVWDMSLYDMLPIRTTLAGKPAEDERTTLAAFRYAQGIQDDPLPMAVEMVYDDAQLTAAAGRMCTYITRDAPGNLTKFFQDNMYYGSFNLYVSDGPVVTDWRGFNNNRVTGGQWWLPGSEEYRVKLAVHSAAPITEIAIYDGPRLLRRFTPNQEKVTLLFSLPHDQQRNLVAEITDAAGKRAVTGGIFVRDYLNWRFMCGDRGNAICDAIQVDEAGAYLTGPTAPYQHKMNAFGLCTGYGERHFNILPPDFDGGMRPIGMHVTPYFSAKDFTFTPPNSTLETRMEVPVCSRDGLLQDDNVVGYFAGNTHAWTIKSAPKDIDGARIRYRYLDITARAHDPGVIYLEGTLTADRPLTLQSMHLFNVFHSAQPGEGDHYALSTPNTNIAGMSQGAPYSATDVAAPGSYACAFPSLWGSTGIIILDDGYAIEVSGRTGNTHFGVFMTGMPRALQAGETLRWRYVLLRGRAGEPPNTAEWERFVRVMGIRSKPAYTVTDIKAGSVQGTKFFLEFTPQDSGVVGTVSYADLPVRLPVRVAAMNPNWTFAWFDLDRKEWQPSAVDAYNNTGFFTLDTRRGNHRLFAGHPVVADNPDVRISAFSDGKSTVRAEVNNAGDAPMTVTLRLNPALAPAPAQTLTLAPGELKTVAFGMGK